MKKKKIRIKKFKPRKFKRDLRFIADFGDFRNKLRTLRLLGILFGLAAVIILLLSKVC